MIDAKQILKDAEAKMESAVLHLEETLSHIRAGKASTKLLDGIMVEYYGSHIPVAQAATVSTPDAKTIVIQPWEKTMLKTIEKAILDSQLGITPENNGEIIRLGIPPLTEERRRTLVKQSKQESENSKISVRNIRRDVIDLFKKAVKEGMPEDVSKDGEAETQKIHDKYIKKLDDLFVAKEKEIMTV